MMYTKLTAVFFFAVVLAACPLRADEPGREAEGQLLKHVRQLTFEGRRSGEGYFNADGTKLIFQSEREPGNPFYQIYLLDLETGDTERLSPGLGKTTCAWVHPDGKKALFASTHGDAASKQLQDEELELRASGKQRRYAWDYDEHFDIYEMDFATRKLTNLTNMRGYDAEGSYSPDGKRIAFSSNRHAYTEKLSAADAERFEHDLSYMLDIYIMDSDGSNVRRLTTARGYDGGPFFSADGKQICWRRFNELGDKAEIFTMDLAGEHERQLTHIGAMSWAPYFHPSGEYLIFTTNRHGFANFELYLVDAKGQRDPVRVTYTDGFDGLPAFSPDGKTLAWTSNRTSSGNSQIFLANWNHDAALRLLSESPQRKVVAGETVPPRVARRGDERTGASINADDIRTRVAVLASDEFDGRLTGTRGEELATAYVAECFQRIGLAPAGDDGYFQNFEFTAGVALGPVNELVLYRGAERGGKTFMVDEDWRPLAISSNEKVEPTEVVFAGYGIRAPKTDEFEEYDSYVHLDVKDKWVLVFRFMPENVTPEQRQHLSRHASLRYKAMVARDQGAKGLLIVTGPNAQARHQLVKLGFDASIAGFSIPSISITDKLAEALLAGTDKSLKGLQDKLDGGEAQMGFALPEVKLAARVDLKRVTHTGRNVIGRLAAGSPDAEQAPFVVVGAHVDHLGHGEGSTSRANEDEAGQIHYGADDNASGVAAMIEMAEWLAAQRAAGKLELQRSIVFIAWSGEELGLIGSKYYVNQLAEKSGAGDDLHRVISAYLNLDMVGRLRDKLILNGIGSSSIWRSEIEQRNAPVGLALSLSDDSYLPTDATSFYMKGVPVLAAFTGTHDEYHTPRDTPETLNYDGAAQIGKFMALVARSLALRNDIPDYLAAQAPDQPGARAGLRAYLGTIPSYGESSVPGVKLDGVSGGGPADKGGLKSGDVIVELAGRKIENIYDYTYAIEALKIGEPVTIVVLRDGTRVSLEVTPGSRE